MEKLYKNKLTYCLFIFPALIVFLATVVLPIAWSCGYSLFDWNGIGEMEFIGIDNYVRMFTSDKVFRIAFKNNLIYVAINVVVQLTFGVLVALLLTKIKKGANFFKTLYFTPAVISSVAICQVFQKILSMEPMGLLNYLLIAIGRGDLARSWTADPHAVLSVVSLVEGYRYIGLYMVIIYSAFISISPDVIEAATIDGARGWSMFSKIKFPLIRRVFVVTLVMVANGTMRGFDIPYLLTRGGPSYRSELLASYMYKTAFLTSKFGYASAMSVFIALECLVVVSLIRKAASLKEE